MIKMRFMGGKARTLNSLTENQDVGFQIATGLLADILTWNGMHAFKYESAKTTYSRRNSSFKSAEGALLASRLNVPSVLISRAARRNAPHAASANPEPTEMRRTPRSAISASVR